jgi:hypothetical protein
MADVLVEFEDLGDVEAAVVAGGCAEAVDVAEEGLGAGGGTLGCWKRALMRVESS